MYNAGEKIKLLPLEALKKTGNVDHADWNYRFFLGYIQRQRFRLMLNLINDSRFGNLLEIGYGSGIFVTHLIEYTDNYYGIDIHTHNDSVKEILKGYKIHANLSSGSAEKMPFENDFFDGIISVSALEFVNDLKAACSEIKRVLKKNGGLFVVTPGHSKLLDLGLKVLTGKSAREDYGDKRERTIPILNENFQVKKQSYFPRLNFGVRLYTALQLSPLK